LRAQKGLDRAGVFFGWRKNSQRFFIVELNEEPLEGYPHGIVSVATLRIVKGQGAEGGLEEVLPVVGGQAGLTKSRSWHHLTVRAVENKVTIMVDDRLACRFDPAAVSVLDSSSGHGIDPRGALGIWAWNGVVASFRGATITALPAADK
jgi:hypothetical protein